MSLAEAIRQGDVLSEARAIVDYECLTTTGKLWVASHELLRRKMNEVVGQVERLEKQVLVLNSEITELRAERDYR